jgi:large subunit ribosomal protein L29
MKAADYRKMTVEELQKELDGLRKTLFQTRAKQVTDVVEKSATIGQTRRDIARVMTILNERRADSQKPAKNPSPGPAKS